MNRKRGCILGLLQIGMMFCVSGGMLVGIVGLGIWHEGVGIDRVLRQFSRPERSLRMSGQSLVRRGPLPGTTAVAQAEVAGPTSIPFTPSPTLTMSPTPIPTAIPIVPMSTPSPASQTVSMPLLAPTPPLDLVQPPPTITPSPAAPPESLSNAAATSPRQLATRLVIPSMNLDAPVVLSPVVGETWDVSHLTNNIGHLERTAGPGSNSNVVLAAHVTLAPDGRAGPFINLSTLAPGDPVIVYRGSQPFTYRIDYLKTVAPTDIEVTYPSDESRLTLITCLNYNRALGRYEERLVAVGHLEQGE